MFLPDRMTLAPEIILFAASVALGSAMASLIGWALSCLCRRCEAPVRHAILLTTVGISVAGPLLLVVGAPMQLGWLRLPLPAIDSQVGQTITLPAVGNELHRDPSFAGIPKEAATSFQHADGWSRLAACWQGLGTVLVMLWLLGVLLGVANAARGIWLLVRFLQTLKIPSHPRLVAVVGDAFRSMGSDRQARIFVTPFAPAPFTLGLLRPIIVVPEYLAADSAGERLRFVLTHEVAHVVRRDQWVALLQRLAGILYWWNPLFRTLNRQLSQAREEICDDYVLQSEGEGRKFAATLLDVAERTALFGLPEGTALLDDDAKSLEQRIRRLLVPRPTPATRTSWRIKLATTLFGGFLLAIVLVARVQSDETQQTNEPAPPHSTEAVAKSETVRPDPPGSDGRHYVTQASDSSAHGGNAAGGAIDLSDNWLLTLPAGFEHPVVFEPLSHNRYRMTPPALNMSGVYERRGDELHLVEPKNPRLTEFKWRLQDLNAILLVEEPPPGKTGAKYAGATLKRVVAHHKRRAETLPQQP